MDTICFAIGALVGAYIGHQVGYGRGAADEILERARDLLRTAECEKTEGK